MNVHIVSGSAVWGGLEAHAVALAEALASLDHAVSILCFGPHTASLYRDRMPPNVDLIDLGPADRRSFLAWRRALRRLGADAAILEKGTLWTGSAALDAALRLTYRRYITIQQLEPPVMPPRTSRRHFGGLIPGAGLWWYRWKLAGYMRSVWPHMTVCVSEAVRRALADPYAFNTARMVTIHNGVNLARYARSPEKCRAARQRWTIPQDALVFGSLRRFVREKGLDVAIEAFAKLRADRPGGNAWLVLIGEGPEQRALEALAARLMVADRVVFPGFTAEPWDAYPGIDVFVIPSRIEALGVVVLEAMASQCVVIGTSVGGIPEMISDSSLGILVPPDNAAALSHAMQQTTAMSPDARLAIGQRGRLHVARHFDARVQAGRIATLLSPAAD